MFKQHLNKLQETCQIISGNKFDISITLIRACSPLGQHWDVRMRLIRIIIYHSGQSLDFLPFMSQEIEANRKWNNLISMDSSDLTMSECDLTGMKISTIDS
jgi:hypothetical protein